MEFILQVLRDSVSGGFWHFIGYYLMVFIIIIAPIKIIKYLIDMLVWYIKNNNLK